MNKPKPAPIIKATYKAKSFTGSQVDLTVKDLDVRTHVCPVCAASMIESDEALMRQALEALQFSSEYLDELGAKLFPDSKKAQPGSTTWHVQKAMAALRGRLDAA